MIFKNKINKIKINIMSLSQIVFKNIDDTIRLFATQIANKYNLNENDLLKIWNDANEKKHEKVEENVSTKNNDLLKLEKKELVEICKSKNLKIGGTKKDLVDRILKHDDELKNQTTIKTQVKTQTQTPVKSDNKIVKKLVEKITPIQIHKNKWGNYEHTETSFVFNNKTQKIYGKQNSDGSISNLTKNDIDICNKFKFSYTIPDNLDKKNDVADVKIKDLDDDDDDDDDEEDQDEVIEDDEINEENLKNEDDEFELEEELEEEEEEYYDEE